MITCPAVQELVSGANQIFTLPDIYFQLNSMIRDPQISLNEIGKIIARDPGLSARLLRLVNSPFYGFQSKIDTISRAITVVGLDELYNMIVATCVVDHFDRIPSDIVDMTAFWIHSVHCGVVVRLLAKESRIIHSERLFLAGLLHDIGSLLLYQKMPAVSLKVLLAANHDKNLIADFEQELLGFTHADVTSELIKSWGLPESLYEPIACYLDPETAGQHKTDAYLLHIATKLVTATEQAIPPEQTAKDLPEHCLNMAHLQRERLPSIIQQADEEFLNVFELVAPKKTLH